MIRRPSTHSGSVTRAAVRRPFSVALAGIAMALAMCAFPLLSAHAETVSLPLEERVTPPPVAPVTPSIAPVPTEPEPTQPKVEPVSVKSPVVVPVQPAPVAPAPGPATEVTGGAEPGDTPSSAASGSAVPSASPTTSSPSPSTSSNWDTPIQDGLKATQAAVVSGTKGPGADIFAVVAIMGGVLLVAGGGIAFALWSRNRFSSH